MAVVGRAQKTTDFSWSFFLPGSSDVEQLNTVAVGAGAVSGLGEAGIRLRFDRLPNATPWGTGAGKAVVNVMMNRQDSFDLSLDFPDPGAGLQFSGSATVENGRGAYAGATGTARVQFKPSPQSIDLSFSGSLSVGGQTISLAATGLSLRLATQSYASINRAAATGTMGPLGNVSLEQVAVEDITRFNQVTLTFRFAAGDSFQTRFSFQSDPTPTLSGVIFGGTGIYDGASGTVTVKLTPDPAGFAVTMNGQVIQPAAGAPIIRGVGLTASDGPIAGNAWIEIQGVNLAPKDTAAGGVFWSNAPEFASGKMPTQLGPISVTVDGKPAYIWWYCSAATTSACVRDQINVLTPPGTSNGFLPVVVKVGNQTSAPFYVNQSAAISPTFLLAQAKGYVLATHADGSLVGPTTLFPGATTPAKKRETIILWGTGFGLPAQGVAAGSATQSAFLPQSISCAIGDQWLGVRAALVSPGLDQLNITIPANLSSGDHPLVCISNVAGYTPVGTIVTVE